MGLEIALWRALTVYRIAALGYAAVLMVGNFQHYAWPPGGWLVVGTMAGWTIATGWAYAVPQRRGWPLLGVDLAVTAACLLSSRWVVQPSGVGLGAPTLPMAWVAAPVIAWAIFGGRWWGATAAALMGAADTVVRAGVSVGTINGTVLMLLSGVIVGHMAKLAKDAEAAMQRAVELEAATRERDRLARGIHDSVLQVLALVQRRGIEIGGEAAELGRLAGAQEATLRALVMSGDSGAGRPALVDLRSLLDRQIAAAAQSSPDTSGPSPAESRSAAASAGTSAAAASAGTSAAAASAGTSAAAASAGMSAAAASAETCAAAATSAGPAEAASGLAGPGAVTVAAPATAVLLPGPVAYEIAAAVASAMDNVGRHAGAAARAWILVEDEPDAVTVTIRDNGVGCTPQRLAQARAEGRLGIAQSIEGRIRDLGGAVSVVSSPGRGTEVELRVPRRSGAG